MDFPILVFCFFFESFLSFMTSAGLFLGLDLACLEQRNLCKQRPYDLINKNSEEGDLGNYCAI